MQHIGGCKRDQSQRPPAFAGDYVRAENPVHSIDALVYGLNSVLSNPSRSFCCRVAMLATLAALVSLAQLIWPARFRYAASEPELQDYVEKVRATAIASGSSQDEATLTAVSAARTVTVQQYAVSASNERLLNQRRANRRTRAGLATLASVFAVLVLAVFVLISKLHGIE